jgi:hypothetical protein
VAESQLQSGEDRRGCSKPSTQRGTGQDESISMMERRHIWELSFILTTVQDLSFVGHTLHSLPTSAGTRYSVLLPLLKKTAFDEPPLFDPPPRSHGRKLLSHPIIANLKKWLHDNSVPNPRKANERHILAFLPSDTHVFGKFAEEFPKGHSFHMSHQSFHHKWKQYCPNIKVVNFLSLLSFHLRETTQTTSQLNQIKTQNFVFRSNQLPKLPVTIVASMKQFMNLLPSGRVRALT